MYVRAGRILTAIVILAAMAVSAHAETSPRVIATYYHRTLRCQTCLHIEALARFDVTDVLADEVASGLLTWRLVNFEEEDNAPLAAAFGLEGPSLVVTLEDGDELIRWTRLDRVWELHGDVAAFDAYVLGAIEEYLVAASLPAEARPEPAPATDRP